MNTYIDKPVKPTDRHTQLKSQQKHFWDFIFVNIRQTVLKMNCCVHGGGWQADGKGASIWDTFTHEGGRVFGEQNGDQACRSYELWDEDLKCIQTLGLTHYRLSLSWARLLPDGNTRHVNQKGISISPFDPCYISIQNSTKEPAYLRVSVLRYLITRVGSFPLFVMTEMCFRL